MIIHRQNLPSIIDFHKKHVNHTSFERSKEQKTESDKPYQSGNEDKQRKAIEAEQLNEARRNGGVFEDYIQSNRNNSDITIEQTSGPSHQIYVIVPFFFL